MKKQLLFLFSMLMAFLPLASSATTWSFEWNKSKKDGGQGFYNFGSSAVKQDFYTAELNGMIWNSSCEGSITYAYTSSYGQYIGKANDPIVGAKLWTNGFTGKVKSVKITTRLKDATNTGTVAVSVNGKSYLHGNATEVSLTKDLAEYEFNIADANAQDGELLIEWKQTSTAKGPFYIKKIEVEYQEATSSVPQPIFTPAAGTYDKAQKVAINAEGLNSGYTMYYTTDGSNPRIAESSRKVYTEPIDITETTNLKAVTVVGDETSNITEGNYIIRKSPDIKFNVKSITLITGEEGYADLLNPNKVSPITYKSSNWQVCSVDKYGALSSSYVKNDSEALIIASFAGDDTYYQQADTLKVLVKAKTPLKTPVVTPLGGSYNTPIEVKITTDDPNAVTIWYSTTAKSAEDFENSDYTESTVVEGNEATVTLDKSCTLYVMTRGYNVNSEVVSAEYKFELPLSVDFTTNRAAVAYYDQEFDSADGLKDWTIGKGWKLANKGFNAIKADDKYSIAINYDDGNSSSTLASPEFSIEKGSKVEFYAHFAPGYLIFGKWTFDVTDLETSETKTLLDAFMWAQDNAYNTETWNKFSFDLSEYAGKKVQFSFNYPFGGENLAIDGFRLLKNDPSAKEAIHIFEGEEIQFQSIVEGEPESIEWNFPGADVETSNEANPTVKYNNAGTYSVTLKAKRGNDTAEKEIKDFVVVTAKAPAALIGLPEEGYESPFVGVFVPINVPVTFKDLSSGNPTEWNWVFQNTDKTSSNEQNPTVTFVKKGTVSVGLTAKNSAGQSNDVLQYAIQAGGAQYVWNINTEENKNLQKINLGFYGNYAGSNWLNIDKFAEKYKAPLADATVDSVNVYFAAANGINPDDEITMTLNSVAANGEPGDVLATAVVKTGDIKYSDDDYLATTFHFDKTVKLKKGTEFFITVGPFPNNSLEVSPYTQDDYAIFCLRRNVGEKTTTWQYLAEEDENYQPTGKYYWIENTDDPVSMAIAPVISYTEIADDIQAVGTSKKQEVAGIYNINGMKVNATQKGGIYIVKYADGTSRKIVVK